MYDRLPLTLLVRLSGALTWCAWRLHRLSSRVDAWAEGACAAAERRLLR